MGGLTIDNAGHMDKNKRAFFVEASAVDSGFGITLDAEKKTNIIAQSLEAQNRKNGQIEPI